MQIAISVPDCTIEKVGVFFIIGSMLKTTVIETFSGASACSVVAQSHLGLRYLFQ